MTGWIAPILFTVATGVGATWVMDALAWLQRRAFGTPSPDYVLVGRWLGHLTRGRVHHEAITRAVPVPAERIIGWAAHYLTGIVFAALPAVVWGEAWMRDPTPGPALAVGLATLALPFLVMQPAMGLGIAASRTPDPALRRRRSLVAHVCYGVGLYVASEAWAHIARAIPG